MAVTIYHCKADWNSTNPFLSITNLVNLTLSGSVPEYVRDSFFGAKLCALSKKDGGLRPIAIGSVYRRLASRMGAHHLASVVGPELILRF